MKKFIFGIFILLLCINLALAGGIVTNANQSAQYIRTLNRNASTSVDAAYYNPAGLAKLDDGIYFLLSNQSISQTKEVASDLATLNAAEYTGEVRAMIFPDVHVAYKMGDLALSGSIMPIGGGGSADYADGLPSFEYNYAGLVGVPASALSPALAAFGTITGYTADAEFSGSSIYFAGQANVAYAVNDMLSVAVGGRYVSANNKYEGSITNVTLKTSSLMDITSTYVPTLADIELEATQTGTGFTGIVGLNATPISGLNIGFRYELATGLELTNENDDPNSVLYPDGEKVNADMPSMIALGASYAVMPQMRAEASLNYFQNTSANWDGDEDDTENGFETGLGIEYGINDALTASVGFLYSKSGATADYRKDTRLNLDSSTLGFGVGYNLTEALQVNIAGLMTTYTEATKTLSALTNTMTPEETYNQSTFVFAFGVNYSL